MFKSLTPKDQEFYDLFDKISAGVREAAQTLTAMLEASSSSDSVELSKKIKTIEHQTDQTVHALVAKLHKTFVTPIDRYDIHQLAVHLDNILDQAEAVSSRIEMYCPDCVPPEAKELAAVLLESTKHVQEMINLLRRLKKPARILELTVEIKRLEDEADHIRRSTVARLFREEKNPVELIKWKDILEYLERATDCCEDVANITEGIVLENT
jgi:predicted phosphate transport protein (TIGR00153 family)